ncbi:putative monovalent cation/H+ antiporter subunit B [Roseivivax jejudonensis]|uniref:Putative monovalent cation/H+ antiporter subunit B n=1 Tax=Roseivivax jejudonensis TaxID=1529041 RepID=A0A1X6Y760_9RHOB|nr:hydrogenase subunit MbhD domain-containing protein [Roseivivax jejudonensis]SLN12208.1 putative monovalent cation/H+ antiporter subunit B [Roseivivax jejudonensis]
MIAFDIVLTLGLLACAAMALTLRDRTASIAAFVVAGLLIALSWVRLAAPDVALAEAAIGAGVTGALFLRSARRIGPITGGPVGGMSASIAAALGAGGLSAALFWAFAGTSGPVPYPPLVAANLEASGVTNPVTAVLLNFRAWDTLLEIAVLAVALALVVMLGPAPVVPRALGELVLPFARIVVPLAILVAGHLLWQGATAPGGAFQAGAVLAGGMLALVLAGIGPAGERIVRGALLLGLAGLAVFVGAALAAEGLTGRFLGYPAGAEKAWIIAIEASLTLSIAATLCLLFTGPVRRPHQ